MFLFTTPSSPPESPPPQARSLPAAPASGPVVQAIRDGATASGVGFDYLLATARRESALDPAAKAGTSSATGLFQFIEQTWLGVMKNAGPRLGLQAQAEAITRQSDGTYTVPDASQRQAILDLRRDPKISATLAGALTQQNADALTSALGREPTAGDLYAAHVLGAKGAAALISTARAFPERAAALDLPEAAAANRALFYDRAGRPRSAAELYASLSAAAQGAAATDLTGLRQDNAAAPQAVSAYASAVALMRWGKRWRSPALIADARHVFADVVTSCGVLAGVGAVILTGYPVLDPVVAGLVALNILWSGFRMVRESVDGLMDRAAPAEMVSQI
ncbi:cation transporter, partial [Methylobacterium sp. B1]|uniref:cation diffusion facilitator family transporter n=1 Tax=Methylobacterium sp. B1 TaxID=91459 RepID=UPI000A01BE49